MSTTSAIGRPLPVVSSGGWAMPSVLLEPWHGHNIAQVAGGCAALLASLLSLCHIGSHVRHNHTTLRKCTVRILLVVPIFAMESSAALMLQASQNNWPMILIYVRDIYESVAMFSFMQYVLTFLGGPRKLSEKLEELGHASGGKVKHFWPFRMVLRDLDCGVDFVAWTMYGIFQCVAVCLTLFVANFCLWLRINFGPTMQEVPIADFWPFSGLTPLAMLRGALDGTKAVSMAFALYNLALFYHETMYLLTPLKPLYKFFSIKGVIFFTFWQGIGITLAGRSGLVPGDDERVILGNLTWTNDTALNHTATGDLSTGRDFVWTRMEVAEGLKNFLLCFEMLFFAVLHRWAYPVNEVHRGELQQLQYRLAEGPGSYRVVGTVSPVRASCDTNAEKVAQVLEGQEVEVVQVGFHKTFLELNYEVEGAAAGLEACNGVYKPRAGEQLNGRPVYRNVKSTSGALFCDGAFWRLAKEPVAGGLCASGYREPTGEGDAPAEGRWPTSGGAPSGVIVTKREVTGILVQMARLKDPAGWVVMHGVLVKAVNKVAEAVDFLDSVTLLREIRDINNEAKAEAALRPRTNLGTYLKGVVQRKHPSPDCDPLASRPQMLSQPMLDHAAEA